MYTGQFLSQILFHQLLIPYFVHNRSSQHPNVLFLLGVETLEGSTVLIMNLVDGQGLDISLFGEKKLNDTQGSKFIIIIVR